MKDFDTDIGGRASRFPPTAWGNLSECSETSKAKRRERLAAFLQPYWKPVYVHI